MKICTVVLAAMLLGFRGDLQSQHFEWAIVEPINISSNPDYLLSNVVVDTAGFPVFSRLLNYRTIYSQDYFGDVIVEKRTPEGAPVFSDTLYGKVCVHGMAVDGCNNLFVYGKSRDTIRVDTAVRTAPGESDCFLLKVSPGGSFIWLKDLSTMSPAIDGIADLSIDQYNRLWAAVEGNFVNSYVRQLDTNGQVVTTYEQTNVRVVSGVTVDGEGTVWAVGSTFNGTMTFNGFNVEAPNSYNFYVVKYRSDGEVAWVRFVEDITLQDPRVVHDGHGQILMSAQLWDAFTFGGLTSYGPEWVYDFYVTRLDSAGNFLWVSEVPQGNTGADAAMGNGRFISSPDSGRVYFCGFSRNQVNWGNGIVSQQFGGKDILVLNYNSAGDVQWAKNAGSALYSDRADALAVDRAGNVYVSGIVGSGAAFDSLEFTGSSTNAFIAKIGTGAVTKVDHHTSLHRALLLPNYPNPFNPSTTIRYELRESGPVRLILYDMLGRAVRTLIDDRRSEGLHTAAWNGRDDKGQLLPSGVYIGRLTAGGESHVQKMILLK